MNLPDLIRALRARCKWTQAQLADQLGVHVRTVQHWETGGDDPTRGYAPGADQIERLADIADVAVTVSTGGEWSYQ